MKPKTPVRAKGKKIKGAKTAPAAGTESANSRNGDLTAAASDVLTLDETASFLRVAAGEIKKLAEEGKLPCRRVSGEWRFLKTALCDWLRTPEPNSGKTYHERVMETAGCLADDETEYEKMSDGEFAAACLLEFEEQVDEDYAAQFAPILKELKRRGRRKQPVSKIQD